MTDFFNLYRSFIVDEDHPCIMAQAVFQNGDVECIPYDSLGTRQTAAALLKDLTRYLDTYDFDSNSFKTLMAIFPTEKIGGEKEFEQKLWQQLQYLHELDPHPWDEAVDPNPGSNNFGFSVGGAAFFVVGMHPKSSRVSRRSPHPCLVFNLHWQFEKLREMGTFDTIRDKIRERDRQVQGSVNPVLKDHGQESEARQYSGREVGDQWQCPFHPTK